MGVYRSDPPVRLSPPPLAPFAPAAAAYLQQQGPRALQQTQCYFRDYPARDTWARQELLPGQAPFAPAAAAFPPAFGSRSLTQKAGLYWRDPTDLYLAAAKILPPAPSFSFPGIALQPVAPHLREPSRAPQIEPLLPKVAPYPTTRTTQPLSAVGPDLANPLNLNLQLLYNPAAFQGDLVTGTPFTADTGSNVTVSSNGASVGHQFLDGQFAYWPSSIITDIGTGDYTVTMLVRPDSFSGNIHNETAFSTVDASDASGIQFNLNDDTFGGANQFGVQEATVGTLHNSPSHVTLATGTFYVLAARRRSGAGLIDVAVNGSYTADGDPGRAFEGGSIVLGTNRGPGGLYGKCTIAFLHIVATAVSDAQLASLATNPWQVFPAADPYDFLGVALPPTASYARDAREPSRVAQQRALVPAASIFAPADPVYNFAGPTLQSVAAHVREPQRARCDAAKVLPPVPDYVLPATLPAAWLREQGRARLTAALLTASSDDPLPAANIQRYDARREWPALRATVNFTAAADSLPPSTIARYDVREVRALPIAYDFTPSADTLPPLSIARYDVRETRVQSLGTTVFPEAQFTYAPPNQSAAWLRPLEARREWTPLAAWFAVFAPADAFYPFAGVALQSVGAFARGQPQYWEMRPLQPWAGLFAPPDPAYVFALPLPAIAARPARAPRALRVNLVAPPEGPIPGATQPLTAHLRAAARAVSPTAAHTPSGDTALPPSALPRAHGREGTSPRLASPSAVYDAAFVFAPVVATPAAHLRERALQAPAPTRSAPSEAIFIPAASIATAYLRDARPARQAPTQVAPTPPFVFAMALSATQAGYLREQESIAYAYARRRYATFLRRIIDPASVCLALALPDAALATALPAVDLSAAVPAIDAQAAPPSVALEAATPSVTLEVIVLEDC